MAKTLLMEISYRMLGKIGIGGQKVDKKGGKYFMQTDPKNTSPHALSKPSSLHLTRPGITQKHPVQETHQHRTNAVFTLPAPFDLNSLLNLLLDMLALKKSPDQSRSPKAGQIFPCKFFGNGLYFLIVNLIFLRYIFLHLLSASSIVFISLKSPYFTIVGGTFILKNDMLPHFLG
ncbi:MAG: hypothetical protein FJ117_02905 [Deltaproteobacteria bacterium]|nr:hypothetical protein [Deltaproteobacteria bacterium]